MPRKYSSSHRSKSTNKKIKKEPRKRPVSYSNPLAIPIHYLRTSIRRAGKLLQEKFVGPVVELSAIYHFDRHLFKVEPRLDVVMKKWNNRINLISCEVFFKDSKHFMTFERNGDSFTVNLADRHPFVKEFILFKYALINKNEVLTVESKYNLQVRFQVCSK